jgi:hypothetical protein
MLPRLLLPRLPRGGPKVEIGVAIPLGCLVPLALGVAMLVSVGVLAGQKLTTPSAPDRVTVRVIDDGAAGGPKVISTQVVPLR